MAVIQFDTDLKSLRLELIKIGLKAADIVGAAARELSGFNMDNIRAIKDGDDEIDDRIREMERRTIELIMRNQPVASDLRALCATFKMITDIERICDQAADIAQILSALTPDSAKDIPGQIKRQGETAAKMVGMAIDAYVKNDMDLAHAVALMDDEEDADFISAEDALSELKAKDAVSAHTLFKYMLISKYFERIGDHAENIADWAAFTINGRHKGRQIVG